MSNEWLTVGAEVGTYSNGNIQVAARSTVAKIGKRDVVLADGQRFNVHTMQRRTGQWTMPVHLAPVTDGSFLRAESKARTARRSRNVERLMAKWRETGDDAHRLAAVAILAGQS